MASLKHFAITSGKIKKVKRDVPLRGIGRVLISLSMAVEPVGG